MRSHSVTFLKHDEIVTPDAITSVKMFYCMYNRMNAGMK